MLKSRVCDAAFLENLNQSIGGEEKSRFRQLRRGKPLKPTCFLEGQLLLGSSLVTRRHTFEMEVAYALCTGLTQPVYDLASPKRLAATKHMKNIFLACTRIRTRLHSEISSFMFQKQLNRFLLLLFF